MTSPRKLDELRPLIDTVDQEILERLRRRAELVLEVGEYKREHGMKVYDPDRERDLLRRLCQAVERPLDKQAVQRIFERIVDEMRRIEQHHID